MKTYTLQSIIQEGGIIVLPEEMKMLQKHRVKLTIVDLEKNKVNATQKLDRLTQKYKNLMENDLDTSEIYLDREQMR